MICFFKDGSIKGYTVPDNAVCTVDDVHPIEMDYCPLKNAYDTDSCECDPNCQYYTEN